MGKKLQVCRAALYRGQLSAGSLPGKEKPQFTLWTHKAFGSSFLTTTFYIFSHLLAFPSETQLEFNRQPADREAQVKGTWQVVLRDCQRQLGAEVSLSPEAELLSLQLCKTLGFTCTV